MLKGAMPSAFAIAGTAVFSIFVSSACMKKATATSHGKKRFTASIEIAEGTAATAASADGLTFAAANFFAMR
jgi:hypothetical protein